MQTSDSLKAILVALAAYPLTVWICWSIYSYATLGEPLPGTNVLLAPLLAGAVSTFIVLLSIGAPSIIIVFLVLLFSVYRKSVPIALAALIGVIAVALPVLLLAQDMEADEIAVQVLAQEAYLAASLAFAMRRRRQGRA